MENYQILKDLFTIAQDVIPVRSSRICAAIYNRSFLISIGINNKKSHPIQKKFAINKDRIYQHAEINAIINALKRQKIIYGNSIYIARARYNENNKTFEFGLSKPCNGCMEALKKYGIKSIHYTDEYFSIRKIEL